jgi:hypothetical protein
MFSRLGPIALAIVAGIALGADGPDDWHLEALKLKTGVELQGVVLFDFRGQVDFAEIRRPAGKPMYSVVRTFRSQEIESLRRLPDKEHQRLLEQFKSFKQRLHLEALQAEQVQLTTQEVEGRTLHRYEGPWFILLSTADAETTRRCVPPVERLFLAYRQLWPPKVQPQTPLIIELWGSFDAYRRQLKNWNLDLEGPAFFSPQHNRIVAGCELDAFSRQLNAVKGEHQQQLQTLNRLDGELPATLARLSEDLKQAGFSDDEIAAEIRQRRAAWKQELNAVRSRVHEMDRRNEAKFLEVTRKMFRRLAHEAWHAYLENYVCPREQHRVPSWLNEGLAQVFETGQLEGETYRIDAPDAERLAALQAELTSARLPLEQVITADEQVFLQGHGGGKSRQHYLYAWGLVWYLAITENRLGGETLDRYLADDEEPLARFERLTGRKLPEFERQWRKAILGLKPAR